MTKRNIEIIVSPDGALRIDAVGFAGQDCEKATAFLEQALGKATRRRHTPDYYRRARVHRTQRLGQ